MSAGTRLDEIPATDAQVAEIRRLLQLPAAHAGPFEHEVRAPGYPHSIVTVLVGPEQNGRWLVSVFWCDRIVGPNPRASAELAAQLLTVLGRG